MQLFDDVFIHSLDFGTTGQQQIIKILPNSSGQQLKTIPKHGTRSTDTPKTITQVILSRKCNQ